MFNLKEFQSNLVLEPIVDKLNKFLTKNKTQKIIQLVEELEDLLDQPEQNVPVTYILSILAEYNISFISQDIIQRIEPFLKSDNIKLKVNSIIILGFFLIAKPKLIKDYFQVIGKMLTDDSKDIRDNVHFFLMELVKGNPNLANSIKNVILKSLSLENSKENIMSLLYILGLSKNLNFDELFLFRGILKSLISTFHDVKNSELSAQLLLLIKRFFPSLTEHNLETLEIESLFDLLDKQFIMKKSNFTEISKNTDTTLKEYLKGINKSIDRENKTYFYTKTNKNIIFIYELESSKLIEFFEGEMKISHEKIRNSFSQIIQNDSELQIFVKTLIKLKIIEGYYSDIGFFYPTRHIKSSLVSDLNKKGIIKLDKFNYLPPQFLRDIIEDIRISQKDVLLLGKNKVSYYSLKRIQEQINKEAAKNSVVDLKSYRERLTEEDFINLIKNLPREYLSSFHKGTQWLTNLGTLRISNEIQSSKIFGFFDIPRNSKKQNIGQILLYDVFINIVDDRSGIWDKKNEVFYYSKYLTDQIEKLSTISDDTEKGMQIDLLAKKLNINKNHIETKLDENLKLIAEEITKKNQIEIHEYLEKTGMDLEAFMNFINDLGVTYFRKADLLIFKEEKIEDAKNDIRFMLLDKSKSVEYLNLGNFDIKSNLIKDLIFDLLKDGKLKGLFYENEGEILFYTERGIGNMMLENSFLFSFKDLFYGKELSLDEIDLMRKIFDDLVAKKRLRGSFDEELLTFSSDEVVFAKDYNTVLFEFEKTVNSYIQTFELEYKKIKRILTKKEETIFPQEIKLIQEIIDKINGKYVWWRNGLEAFIRRANEKLLRDQGVSVKKYKHIFSTEQKEEIKSFEEDPEVFDRLNNFKSWVKVFNKLEVKYPSAIFYHKRTTTNPDDTESKDKLKGLLDELFLI
ncbi:MAG: hypothetical protein ACXAC5_10945 [Promethearchaeota archaeon]|jgi:hypothetical protein